VTRLELSGWLVFLASGLGFLVSGAIAGDMWVIAGSVLFELGILMLVFDRRT
jgi:hypothetical protein